MSKRDEIASLKASRRGFKSALTRARKSAQSALDDYILGDDPVLLENFLGHWDDRLQKYLFAEDQVICHLDADANDADSAVDEQTNAFFKAKSIIIGFRRDVDASNLQAVGGNQPDPARGSGIPPLPLPKVDAKKPPILHEDTNHKVFTRWRPLWVNYARLTSLDQRDQAIQVGLFWECCSPGFLKIIVHSLGIKMETGRPVTEILDLLEDHLRSLRNVHLDMRDLLAVRQTEGQDYTSFCGTIRELADYADASKVTEDRLLIALLLQGMRDDSDKAKTMERNPSTFDDARRHILELETSRNGVHEFGSRPRSSLSFAVHKDQTVNAAKSNYRKLGGKSGKWPGTKADHFECHGCGRLGHWRPVCRQREDKKASGVHVCVASTSFPDRGNRVNVEVTPSGSSKSVRVQFCADTGADVVIMGINQFRDSDLCQMTPIESRFGEANISGVDGRALNLFGTFQADLSLDKEHRVQDVTVVVSSDLDDAYLGLDACRALGIVGPAFPQPMVSAIPKALGSPLDPTKHVWPLNLREEWISSLPKCPSVSDFSNAEAKLRSIYSAAFDASSLKPLRGPIVGDPMVITLKDGAIPFAINTARQIPIPQMKEVQTMLEAMCVQKIIEPVGDVPTKWCHPIVVVPKSDGSFRLCVDLTRLNTEVVRSIHPTKTPAEAISGFQSTDEYFLKLDLVKGYWQMPLDPNSQELTTFITPFGKYRFLRSPMGFISTGDSFSYRGDIAMSGLNVQKVIDDMAAGAKEYPDLIRLTCNILERCVRYGMTVNAKKSVIGGARDIDFVGFRISRNKIEADPEKVDAIRRFPPPEDRRDLRSFLGLVNQLGQFSSSIAKTAEPLRGLLKTKNTFLWLPEHVVAFNEVKRALTSPPILGMYTIGAETVLQTDASKLKGLGFVLLQRLEDQWRLIQCGSRFLKDAETRYAIVELEALAIYWAIRKCRTYLAGMEHFKVLSDHKPLQTIFNQQMLNAIENPRILNYRSRLSSFKFTVEWRCGKTHFIPDALSRAPISIPEVIDDLDPDPSNLQVALVKAHESDLTLEDLSSHARESQDYGCLRDAIKQNIVAKARSGYVSLFKKMSDELSLDGNLILRGSRIVIPPPAIKNILSLLHSSHQGIERTKRRARQIVFWPGFNSDIANMVEACSECAYFRPSNPPEPLIQMDHPSRPFEMVSADFFSYGGHEYLVYTCRFSGFPFIQRFHAPPTASTLIRELRWLFSVMGVPNVFRSDNATVFSSSVCQDFFRLWGVQWRPSSPHHPQSNGHAEANVK
ncbi:uncharacterized protein LOC131890587 [Tigriopus californicus]|uniref:uncharacterized protein LOC131890587 n=1 Tax=Tigriopus californicus TaxID=6832 RepID=UPI0027DA754D|nr:uncharacterized protein LOC131890587 [Tigriopus californicus]